MPENEIYKFLKENDLTDKDEASFTKEYSDPKKAKELHNFMIENDLTDKDSATFYETYFDPSKKKVQNTPTTSNGLENSSTQELGSSGKTKTVEEFNAKYGTNYTDLKTGQTKVDNAEKGVLVPFSPIKAKQPSGEKDFIAPKVTLPGLTKAPMKRYERAYDGITSRIDNNTKEFDKVTAEAEKQGKELEGIVNKYNNELKQASTVVQNELKAKYEGLLKAGSISVEDANLKFQEEYKKGYGIAEKEITSKYKPSLDSYTSLLDKRKTLGNSINSDIERAKLLSNSVGIIERNVNAQNVSEYNNLENLTVSGLSMLGSAMSGSLPFFLRFTNNNLSEFAAKNNMPELSKVAFEKQESLEKSELLQKMEAYAKEQAQKGSYYSNKITEKEGTLVDNFSQGNYAQAGKVAGLRFLESIPMMGAAIGMTALTGGTASAIIPGGFMFGSQNYYGEYADRPDMSETDKLNASFVKGSLEMITELSVMPLLSPLKGLIKTGGKEAVREAVEKTLFNSMKEGYGKLVPYFGWVQEGLSEYANEVGSTITDKILDPKFQDKDWGEVIKEANLRGLEAFGPGAFGGATLTLPVAINNTINKYQNKKMAREFAAELEKIEADIQNPNLTEAQKDILIARKQEIHGKLNEVFDADKQETVGATTEQVSTLDDINDQQDEVTIALQDETISDESKVAFEAKAKELAEQEKTVLEEIKANEIVNKEEPNTADNGLSNDVVEPNTVKVEPIRQLGTGKNVYFETDKYRVNDIDGGVILNIQNQTDLVPVANIKFDNANDAVIIAKEINNKFPNGVPDALLVDKYVEQLKKELLSPTTEKAKGETAVTAPDVSESGDVGVGGDVTFQGKRGQADSITFDGKTIKQGEEIELNDVNISQDDSMPDLRSGKYKVRMLSVDANGKTATLTLTDGNEVITTTVKDLRKSEQSIKETPQTPTTKETKTDESPVNEIKNGTNGLELFNEAKTFGINKSPDITDIVMNTDVLFTTNNKGEKLQEGEGSLQELRDIIKENPKNKVRLVEVRKDGDITAVTIRVGGQETIYKVDTKAVEELLAKEQTPNNKEQAKTPTNTKETPNKEEKVENKEQTPIEKERARQIELLDTVKKIAQLEKEIRRAPVRGSKGQLSQKQLRIQLQNLKEQLRDLKGLPPKKKATDSVLRITKRNFASTIDMSQLSFDEQLIFSAIGSISANDKDIVSSDANKQLRKQGALLKQGGLTIDQIVTDFINENDLDADMAQDFRNTLIDFVNGGDAYAWMNKIKEREAQLDPDAIRENEFFDDAYDVAVEYDLTDEEINELELEVIKQNELTQEEYEKLRNEFSNEGTEEGIVATESKADSSKEKDQARKSELEAKVKEAKNAYDALAKKLAKAKQAAEKAGQEQQANIFGGKPADALLFGTDLRSLNNKVKEMQAEADTAKENLDKAQLALDSFVPSNQVQLEVETPIQEQVVDSDSAELADLKEQLKKARTTPTKREIQAKIDALEGNEPKQEKGPSGGLASKTAKNTNQITPTQNAEKVKMKFHLDLKKLIESIGVPIAEGNLSKRFLGIFKNRSKNIRVQSLFGVATAAHETAHWVSKEFGIGTRLASKSAVEPSNPKAGMNKAIRKALTDIYVEFYPNAKREHSLSLRVEEGIAVLMEHYLTDPTDIQKRYPGLVYHFINPIGEYYNPKFTELLDKLNKFIGEYSALTDNQKIGSRIVSGEEVNKKNKGFTPAQSVVRGLVNAAEPLRRADNIADAGLTEESAEVAYIRWLSRAGIIAPWVTGETHPITLGSNGNWKEVGASVKDYLELIKGEEDNFNEYLVARRNVGDVNYLTEMENELAEIMANIDNEEALTKEEVEEINKLWARIEKQKQIIKNDNFDIQQATATVEMFEDKFKEAVAIYDKLNNAVVDFAQKAGLISSEKAESYKANTTYTAFKRLIIDDISSSITAPGTSSQSQVSAFKERTGSDKAIISPIYSQIQFITETLNKGMQNMIWQKLAALGDNNAELARRFEKVETVRIIDPISGRVTYPQMNENGTIMVKTNGKPSFYLAAPEYVALAETLTPKELETMAYILTKSAGIFSRLTTSANPLFPLVNIPIDTMSAWMNTKTGFIPGWSQMRALPQMASYAKDKAMLSVKNLANTAIDFLHNMVIIGDWFKGIKNIPIKNLSLEEQNLFAKYLALGGSTQTLSAYLDMSPEEMIKAVTEKSLVKKVVQHIDDFTLGILEMPSNASEYMTRFAEFKRAKEQGYSDDVAMYMAAHVSVPFIQSGTYGGQVGKTAVKAVPYFHAGIQVISKFAQTLKNDPVRTATIGAALIAIKISQTLLTMALADDEDKEMLAEQETSEFAKYIYLPNKLYGGKGFTRIRFSNEFGSISTPIEMMIIQNKGLAHYTLQDYLDATTTAIPAQFNIFKPIEALWAYTPQLVRPSLEVGFNVRTYPNVRPIVPYGVSFKSPMNQYNQYTTETSKFLGKLANVSPMKIDYFIKAQFGKVPDMLLRKVEQEILDKKDKSKSQLFLQAEQYVLAGRNYNNFYKNNKYWDELSNDIKSSKKKHSEYTTEENEIIENHKIFNNTEEIIKKMRDKVNNNIELPEYLKESAFDLLKEINASGTPYKFSDKYYQLKSNYNKAFPPKQ